MLRIVLPVVSTVDVVSVPAIDVGIPVGIVDEVIVVVDRNVVVATPAGMVSPASAPSRPHRYANAEAYGCAGEISPHWRIGDRGIRVNRRAVDYHRVIAGNVYHLRVGLLNHNYGLILHYLRFHGLLLGGLQVTRALGLRAHALHCVHHITLLCQEGIAQVRSPLDVLRELLGRVGYRRHGLHAGVPVLLLDGRHKGLVLQIRVR